MEQLTATRVSGMTDDCCEYALRTWGRWLRRGRYANLGFKSVNYLVSWMKFGPGLGQGKSETSNDSLAERVNTEINKIREHRPEVAKALQVRYQNTYMNGDGLRDDDCARRARMKKRTFQRRLQEGRQLLKGRI